MSAKRQKVEFTNKAGVKLSGVLEAPVEAPRSYALFAHCFTCSKDIPAASRICQTLAAKGIATLRFDFAGIGKSEGAFEDTNFSTNVEDLAAAADFMRDQYEAPSIIIGHSLGGAAVLWAAHKVPEAKAVVTIAAPSTPDHVRHHFEKHEDEINAEGQADVLLGGRPFVVKKHFIDDIEAQHEEQDKMIGSLRKALLVFHSPMDDTVSINQAAIIYGAAKHPKSFISLEKADHLLTKREDAQYVADAIVAWVTRYLPEVITAGGHQSDAAAGEVLIVERNKAYTREVITQGHNWVADEPVDAGGANLGPNPFDMLLASLGSCTSMTIRMYANLKDLPLDAVRVKLKHERTDDGASKIERIIELDGDLSKAQKQKVLEIADRTPVTRALQGEAVVSTKLV